MGTNQLTNIREYISASALASSLSHFRPATANLFSLLNASSSRFNFLISPSRSRRALSAVPVGALALRCEIFGVDGGLGERGDQELSWTLRELLGEREGVGDGDR